MSGHAQVLKSERGRHKGQKEGRSPRREKEGEAGGRTEQIVRHK
jgi:hypothetical protein